MMTGFLFAFCMSVSLNFNSELFLFQCLFVSLLIFAYFARSKTEAPFSYSFLLMSDTCDFKSCVALHVRIANLLVMGSCCRGGIVNTRGGFSCKRFVPPNSSKALWRFRASTSNSPSGRSRLHTHTHLRHIYHTYAQQDIRVCEDDHLKPPNWQYTNPKALWLLRVSI